MLKYVVGFEQLHSFGIPNLKLFSFDHSSIEGGAWIRYAHSWIGVSRLRMIVSMSEGMVSFDVDADVVVELLNCFEVADLGFNFFHFFIDFDSDDEDHHD